MTRRSDVPRLVGTGEAADILEVPVSYIKRFRERKIEPVFPDPVEVLSATPIWVRDDIVKFKRRYKRWLDRQDKGDRKRQYQPGKEPPSRKRSAT